MDEQLGGIHKKLGEMDQKMNNHSEMIGQMMVDITTIKSGLKLKVDYDEFTGLEKRVSRLEARARK